MWMSCAIATVSRMTDVDASTPDPESADSAAETPAPDTPATKKLDRTTMYALIVLAVVGLIVWAISAKQNNPETTRSNTAAQACEDAVKDQLKAPSTAKFTNERYTDSDPSWLVTGDVDAQNSFGAMIRSHFTCDLT